MRMVGRKRSPPQHRTRGRSNEGSARGDSIYEVRFTKSGRGRWKIEVVPEIGRLVSRGRPITPSYGTHDRAC
jgi:hypothetical protein